MVDAKNLFLGEDFVQFSVERHGAFEVGAERLLHDDARVLDEFGFAQQTHRRERRVGRHAQIVNPAAITAERLFSGVHGVLESRGARAQRHVVEAVGEGVPISFVDFARRERVDGFARDHPKRFDVEFVERDADDFAAGNKAGRRKVKQARQQLAPGQIAGRADEHDDLRESRSNAGRYFLCQTISRTVTQATRGHRGNSLSFETRFTAPHARAA